MASVFWVGGAASWDGTAGTKWAATSGGVGGQPIPTSVDDVFFDAASGTNTVTIAAGNTGCASIDCTGFTGTLAGSAALTVSGLMYKLAVTMAAYTYTGALTFASTSGTTDITSAGWQMDHDVTLDGVGGTFRLADVCVGGKTKTLTLTRGTFNANNQTGWGWGKIASNNANTRVWTHGSGTCLVSWDGLAATAIDFGTTTGLTFTANTGTFELSGAPSAARTVNGGSITAFPALKVSAGSDALITTNVNCASYTQTSGFTGAKTNTAMTVRGALSLNAANGTPAAGAAIVTFSHTTSTSYLIDTGGKTVGFPFTFAGGSAGTQGGWTLASDMTSSATRQLILTGGILNVSTFTFTIGNMTDSASASYRGLSGDTGGTIKLMATGSITIYSVTGTPGTWYLYNVLGLVIGTNGSLVTVELAAVTANTRSIAGNTSGGAYHPNFKVSAGTGQVNFITLFFKMWHYTQTAGYTGSWAMSGGDLYIHGNLSLNAANGPPVAGSLWLYFAEDGTKTIDTAGKTLPASVGFSYYIASATWTLLSNMTLGAARTTAMTAVTGSAGSSNLNLNGFTLSTGAFLDGGNALTKTLTFGTGGRLDLTNTATGTILTMTAAGWTVYPAGGEVRLSGASGAGITRTVSMSTSYSINMPALSVTGGTSTAAVTVISYSSSIGAFSDATARSGATTWQSCAFAGITLGASYTGVPTVSTSGTARLTVTGDVVMAAANGNWVSNAAGITFAPPAATTISITSAANTWNNAITVSASDDAGIIRLVDAFTIGDTSQWTLTRGTWDQGTNNVGTTVQNVVVTNSTNTRGISFGNGVFSVKTTLAATAWSQATSTTQPVYTYGTGYADITGVTASTRSFVGVSTTVMPRLRFSGGNTTASFTFTTTKLDDLTFMSSYTGTLANQAITIVGSVSFAAGATYTAGANAWTYAATASKTITSGGVTLDWPHTFDGVGGTWQLQDALTAGARAITVTRGTLDENGKAISSGSAALSSSNVRGVTQGAGTWSVSAAGTAWDLGTSTNMTLSAASGTVKLTNASASAKTFAGGGKTYGTVWLAPAAGTGDQNITGSNTYETFKDDGTVAHSIKVAAGTTQTTTVFDVVGHIGNLITVTSDSAAAHYWVGTAWMADKTYLNLSWSNASPSDYWNAGTGSIDSGNNVGWFDAGAQGATITTPTKTVASSGLISALTSTSAVEPTPSATSFGLDAAASAGAAAILPTVSVILVTGTLGSVFVPLPGLTVVGSAPDTTGVFGLVRSGPLLLESLGAEVEDATVVAGTGTHTVTGVAAVTGEAVIVTLAGVVLAVPPALHALITASDTFVGVGTLLSPLSDGAITESLTQIGELSSARLYVVSTEQTASDGAGSADTQPIVGAVLAEAADAAAEFLLPPLTWDGVIYGYPPYPQLLRQVLLLPSISSAVTLNATVATQVVLSDRL